jgi:hypothetical protein
MMMYLICFGSRPSFCIPPTISSSELYGKIVSMRMMPSLVVSAQDE